MIDKAAAHAAEQPQALRSVFGMRTAAHAPVFADSGSHGGLGMVGGGGAPRRTQSGLRCCYVSRLTVIGRKCASKLLIPVHGAVNHV
jgi:hypothetical protein